MRAGKSLIAAAYRCCNACASSPVETLVLNSGGLLHRASCAASLARYNGKLRETPLLPGTTVSLSSLYRQTHSEVATVELSLMKHHEQDNKNIQQHSEKHSGHHQQQLQKQPQQQQQQQQIPHDINSWAAIKASSIIRQLHDQNGQPLPPREADDIKSAITKLLGIECTTGASWLRRQTMAMAVPQLLQCVLDLGFTAANTRRVARQANLMKTSPDRVHSTLNQLKLIGGITDRQAVAVLGKCPETLSHSPYKLGSRLRNVQQLTGMSAAQTSIMLRYSTACLNISSKQISAVINALSGLGYTKDEQGRILSRGTTVIGYAAETIIKKHEQLQALLGATPADIRSFVLTHPTLLCVNIAGQLVTDKIQLWQTETGRPLKSVLGVPSLFQRSLGRTAARLCFMKEHGHTLTPAATVLFIPFEGFSRSLGVSEEKYATWRKGWLATPKGFRYGSSTSSM